jgi:hypothetical protein
MSKPLKITAIVIGALVALCLLALVLIPSFIPLESMITQALNESTGRPVKVRSVSLSILGGLSLEVEGLEVAELPEFGERPMLVMKRMEMDAALLPLLSSSLVVDDFKVEGLELSLVRNKEGRLNLEGVPAGPRTRTSVSPSPEAAASDDDGKLLIKKAVVTGSKVWLTNLATGKSDEIPLEECRLALELGQDSMAMDLVLKMPGLALAITPGPQPAKGHQGHLEIKADLAEFGRRLTAVVPEMKTRGLVTCAFDLANDGKAMTSKGTLTIKDLLVDPGLPGKQPFQLSDFSLVMDTLARVEREVVEVKQLELVSAGAGLSFKAQGTFGLGDSRRATKGAVSAGLDLGKLHALLAHFPVDLPQARGRIKAEVTLNAGSRGDLAVKGQAGGNDLFINDEAKGLLFQEKAFSLTCDLTAGGEANRVEIKEISIDSTPVALTVSGLMREVEEGRTSVELRIKGDHLDLDYLAALGAGKQKDPAPAGQAAGKPAADPSADLKAALKGLSALMTLDVAKINYQDMLITDLKGEVRVLDGVIKLPGLTGRPLGGYMKLVGSLDSNAEPAVTTLNLLTEGLKLDRAAMPKLRRALPVFNLPVASIEGEVNVAGNFAFKGLAPQAIQETLDGQGTLLAPKGVTLGFGFLDNLPLAKGLPRRFDKMSGNYMIRKQRMDYDLNFYDEQELKQAELKGHTLLSDKSVEAKLSFDKETVNPALKPYLGEDGTLPIALGGTVESPKAKLAVSPTELAPVKGLIKGLFNR